MYDDDRFSPKSEIPDQPTELELRLQEYDWLASARGDEVECEEVQHALAVLAVMELEDDEDYEEFGSLWLH